ncbi:endo-1,4-beta-xylanase [Sphingobacterium spiritivorum]|uniref:endo-1,4-beta-xylanase n=1 Tax=Sphingobacterium spiritivorum TaxID=258 RepID=UPI003DA54680
MLTTKQKKMEANSKSLIFIAAVSFAFTACNKNEIGKVSPLSMDDSKLTAVIDSTDTSGRLKDFTDFPIGFAIAKDLALNTSSQFFSIVKREADMVTFENVMKHQYNVNNDGTLNFSQSDQLANLCADAGLPIYGHVLVWHSQQNANYLNSLVPLEDRTNKIVNGGFETGADAATGDILTGWRILNSLNGSFSSVSSGQPYSGSGGSKGLKSVTTSVGQKWHTQIINRNPVTVVQGKKYLLSFWVKADRTGSMQFEIRSSGAPVKYEAVSGVGTSWRQIVYKYTATSNDLQVAFDMGGEANTFYIDNVSVLSDVPGTPTATNVENAMKTYIEGMVNHFKGKVTQWDVFNEAFNNDGSLRSLTNNDLSKSNVFIWEHYLGRDFAKKAFMYARQADPVADLFMNDYALERSSQKLNAFVTLAKELKAANAGITGVSTQMHIDVNTGKSGIDNAFRQLASTGLKVKVTELDISCNSSNPTQALLQSQSDMYKYVVQSYKANVPAAQRAGITTWGVYDGSTWIQNDAPLLFDKNFNKKPAYVGFKRGLLGL